MKVIYDDYMRSDIWKAVREEVIRRSKGRCRLCGRKVKRGVVHHRTYENWGKGNVEEVNDCDYLHFKCHDYLHSILATNMVPFFAKRKFEHEYYAGQKSFIIERIQT